MLADGQEASEYSPESLRVLNEVLTEASRYFSPAVADAESRQVFASNIRAFYDTFDLDGIDIDWEYPGQAGNDGNSVSPDDTANFLSFLQLLRQTLPATAKMSAAVQTVPFAGADGSPLADVSAFAQVLDWVLIMNYDAWGCTYTRSPLPNRTRADQRPGTCSLPDARAQRAAQRRVPQLDAAHCERRGRRARVDGGGLPRGQARARRARVRVYLPVERDEPPPAIRVGRALGAAQAPSAPAEPAPRTIVAPPVGGCSGHGGRRARFGGDLRGCV